MKTLTLIFLFALSSFFSFAQTAQELYDEAYQQLTEGVNAAVVVQTLQACINTDKSFEEAYILRAFVFYKLGDYEAAIKDYSSLLEVNPNHLEALKQRAFTRIQTKDYVGAIEDHTKRIKINSQNAVAYFDRAYCQGLIGKNDLAIEDYSEAIRLDYKYAAAYKNRGIALINEVIAAKKGKHPTIDEAEEACNDFATALQYGETSAKEYLFKYCVEE